MTSLRTGGRGGAADELEEEVPSEEHGASENMSTGSEKNMTKQNEIVLRILEIVQI